jgi:hypothetical protein
VPGFGSPSMTKSLRPGDWMCTCGEHVFASKDSCRKCGAMKPVPANPSYLAQQNQYSGHPTGPHSEVRPGDWRCDCGFNNFSSRAECHKCKKAKQ